MTDVEQARIECDERGFELHLIVDDDIQVSPEGRVVLNIQHVAADLYDQMIEKVGPWVFEMNAARREYERGIADDPAQQEILDEIQGGRQNLLASIREAGYTEDAAERILESVDQALKADKENPRYTRADYERDKANGERSGRGLWGKR